MAIISINIPDEVLGRVVDGVCGFYGYRAEINGSPNPETKNQFARRMNREWMKNCVKKWESSLAYDVGYDSAVADRLAAEAAVEAEIILT